MKLLDVHEAARERKKDQRRIDLFRRENLETWLLVFPPGDVHKDAQPSLGLHLLRHHGAGNHEGAR